ncbi:MAG TPA: homocysteine S-methyltransferase family protein [Chthoniobacteraceae bacterium]|jgi:homocysteine S-methyltransferase
MDLLEELQLRILPADGAMGTELLRAGIPRERCLEELCVSQPDLVAGIHRAYLAAGARLIKTNSFGANAVRLAKHAFGHRVSELNWTAAQLAKESVKGTGARVMGSVGPLGLSPAETKSAGINVEEVFTEQIGALLDGGARVILLETFTDLPELLTAIHVKHSLHHCPVIASVACDSAGRLADGTTLAEAFLQLKAADADLVAVNCVTPTPALLSALVPLPADLTLAAFPSAGIPGDPEESHPVSPEQFARSGVALAQLGARIIGGCCGAGTAHIAALVAALGGEKPGADAGESSPRA